MTVTDPRPPDEFQSLRLRVFELIEDGRLDTALGVALKVEEHYPAKGEVPFWLACIHGRAGRAGEGLAALRGGLARGLWWPDEWLLDDDDLVPLRRSPDFAGLVEASRANQDEAGDEFVAESMVLAPERERTAVGAVLALHGWGGDAVAFSRAWWAAADAGYVVVVPESSQMPSPGFFVWTDREAALADIEAVWSASEADHGLAGLPLVIAGFSQGGGLAVELALDGRPAAAAAFLALSAGTPEDVTPEPGAAALAADRGLRGRLIVGERDEHAVPQARELARRLGEAGLDCPLTLEPGLAHELPRDLGARLPDLLGALLGRA